MIKKTIKKLSGSRRSNDLHVYANLSPRKAKKEARTRRKAEYLASLPKNPAKRLLYRLHPQRVAKFWFSREGAIMGLKIVGVFAVILAILIGGLFAYYRHELSAISPEELAKRVQTTVTRYYDRNNVLLWEDKGSGDYKLVVKGNEINKYMKDATVAIEDKDFYNEGGISFNGLFRAVFSNLTGGDTQGGSTLTQQLIKQVFFADQAQNRGLSGIPRKIKEIILAIEADRMYSKDEILSMYLNESPYGGRRNGVESAAQEYFGKAAKDLTLPEAALLAAIPQEPGYYNPRNTDPDANKALVKRQQLVLDYMADQGKITKQQAEDAKKVPILAELQPEKPSTAKAPYFVAMVQQQLKQQLGASVVGQGGLTVVTTLDYRAQQIAEQKMNDLFNSYAPRAAGFDNGAMTVLDTKTSQVIALLGGRDYEYPGYGQVNEADAWLQQGSSVKPLVYSALMEKKSGANYGAGSILNDDALPQSIYATGNGQPLGDSGRPFVGPQHIRDALAQSRNVPAVRAMYLNDKANGYHATIKKMQDYGDTQYCTNGPDKQVALSAAFGGCGGKLTELANSYTTLGRLGEKKPISYILKVTNGQNQVIQEWKDDKGTQVLDPQIAYIMNDILADDNARAPLEGHNAAGFVIPGIKTGTKTGTSDDGANHAKDLWFNSFNPGITITMWLGNHDNSNLGQAFSKSLGVTVGAVMSPIIKDIYQPEGKWKPGDWYTMPQGVQRLNVNGSNDLYPSWYNKDKAPSQGTQMTFDTISKKKATDCTPARAKTTLTVTTATDPVTNKSSTIAPDGYDADHDDDVHQCGVAPYANAPVITPAGVHTANVKVDVNDSTGATLTGVEIYVNGNLVATVPASGTSDTVTYTYTAPSAGTYTFSAIAVDSLLYASPSSGTQSATLASTQTPSGGTSSGGSTGTLRHRRGSIVTIP